MVEKERVEEAEGGTRTKSSASKRVSVDDVEEENREGRRDGEVDEAVEGSEEAELVLCSCLERAMMAC